MRSTIVLFALAASAVAQLIDFTQVDAAPETEVETAPIGMSAQAVSVVPSSSATALAAAAVSASPLSSRDIIFALKTKRAKRDACSNSSASTDTPEDFLANTEYSNAAYAAPIPTGYDQVFTNLNGSTQQSGYMGFKTLTSYDTAGCSQYCSSTADCKAFNIYYERDPSVDASDSCPNPSSVTNIKCVLWGNQISSDTATNTGQWREQFQVVIAGSNGYAFNATAPTVSGFAPPIELGGALLAPLSNGVETYMGYKYFSFGTGDGQYPYEDPILCTEVCSAQTAYNANNPPADGSAPQACEQVIAYVLSKNGAPQGQYCSTYSQIWDASFATNYGQYRGSDYYSVEEAWMYNVD